MGVRKFRSIEQVPARGSRPRLDPENLRLALGLASLAGGLNRVPLVPGVGKYRSWDEAFSASASPIPQRSPISLSESYRRLEALVRTAIPEGVTYRARLSPNEIEAGFFDPAPFGFPPPQIVLYRDHMDEPGDVLQELLTLAHELGHFRSSTKGLRTAEYEAAVRVPWTMWPDLTNQARRAVLDEERNAWRFAREILAEVGFSEWDAFADRHREALSDYRNRLQLDREALTEPGGPSQR